MFYRPFKLSLSFFLCKTVFLWPCEYYFKEKICKTYIKILSRCVNVKWMMNDECKVNVKCTFGIEWRLGSFFQLKDWILDQDLCLLVVYLYSCGDSASSCVGQTKHQLRTRIDNHRCVKVWTLGESRLFWHT